ncbi:voltage-gated potassium channel [Aureococcus anophagefferens]|nr:voltage-gated potassium channel [Aureococcus anophagefferens]
MAMRRLALLACAALAAAQLYEDHDHVQEFTSSSAFEKAILEDDAAMWVVHFYQSGDEDKGSPMMADDFAASAQEVYATLGVPLVLGFGGASTKNPYTGKSDRPVVAFEQVMTESGFSKTSFKRWVSRVVVPGDAVSRVDRDGDELPVLLAGADAFTSREALTAYDGDLKDRGAVVEWLEAALKEKKASSSAKAEAAAEPAEEAGWPAGYVLATAKSAEDYARLVVDANRRRRTTGRGPARWQGPRLRRLRRRRRRGGGLRRLRAGGPTAPTARDRRRSRLRWRRRRAAFDAAAGTLAADDVMVIAGSMDMDAFIRRAISAGEGDAPVGVALFTKKGDVSPAIRALATTLGKHAGVKVAQYSNPEPGALEAYGVRKLPSVLAFFAQAPDETTPMDQRAIGAAQYDRRQFGPPSFRSLVAFSWTSWASSRRTSRTRRRLPRRAEPDAAVKKEKARAGGPAPKKGGAVFASFNDADAWAELRRRKERYAALVGRYAAADVKSFLRGVVSGRVPTAPLRATPRPRRRLRRRPRCRARRGPLDDDFMAELAEEAAKAAELEKEAAEESSA